MACCCRRLFGSEATSAVTAGGVATPRTLRVVKLVGRQVDRLVVRRQVAVARRQPLGRRAAVGVEAAQVAQEQVRNLAQVPTVRRALVARDAPHRLVVVARVVWVRWVRSWERLVSESDPQLEATGLRRKACNASIRANGGAMRRPGFTRPGGRCCSRRTRCARSRSCGGRRSTRRPRRSGSGSGPLAAGSVVRQAPISAAGTSGVPISFQPLKSPAICTRRAASNLMRKTVSPSSVRRTP